MAFTPPKDFSEMMKFYDPEQVARMFDAVKFWENLTPTLKPPLDVNVLLESSTRNVQALQAANKSAAAAHQNFLLKQMEIFEKVTEPARQALTSAEPGRVDEIAKRTASYQKAVEKALLLMTEYATAVEVAQETAAKIMERRIADTVSDLKDL
ncbi:MAG: hypothetical protein AcusKO_19820 [Acuticoccus sp.]